MHLFSKCPISRYLNRCLVTQTSSGRSVPAQNQVWLRRWYGYWDYYTKTGILTFKANMIQLKSSYRCSDSLSLESSVPLNLRHDGRLVTEFLLHLTKDSPHFKLWQNVWFIKAKRSQILFPLLCLFMFKVWVCFSKVTQKAPAGLLFIRKIEKWTYVDKSLDTNCFPF